MFVYVRIIHQSYSCCSKEVSVFLVVFLYPTAVLVNSRASWVRPDRAGRLLLNIGFERVQPSVDEATKSGWTCTDVYENTPVFVRVIFLIMQACQHVRHSAMYVSTKLTYIKVKS